MEKKQKPRRRLLSHWGLKDKMALFLFVMMGVMVVFSVMLGIQDDEAATGPNITFEEYEKQELALDDSTENVRYVEPEQTLEMQMEIAKLQAQQNTQEQQDTPKKEDTRETEAPVEEPKYDYLDEVKIPDVKFPFYVKVNRVMNCVTVYMMDEQGEYTIPVKAMICSVGKNNNTPLGVFQTSTKYEWRALFGNVYGQYAYRIHNSIMFHSVPYYSINKGDLETEEYNKLGEPASLGCIRLACIDAKWLVDYCPEGTTVEIYDDEDSPGPLGRPDAVRIDVNSKYAGWDPTDPDSKNPWKKGKDKKAEGEGQKQSQMAETQKNEETVSESFEQQETQKDTADKQDKKDEQSGQKPIITVSGELATSMNAQGNPEDVVFDNAQMMAEMLVSNQVSATDATGQIILTPQIQILSADKIFDSENGALTKVNVSIRVSVVGSDQASASRDVVVTVTVLP